MELYFKPVMLQTIVNDLNDASTVSSSFDEVLEALSDCPMKLFIWEVGSTVK